MVSNPPLINASGRRAAFAILLVAGAAAVVLHVMAGHTFPVPWPDEIDFLGPAAQLARHGGLGTSELNSPSGMFWMSDLYYVVLAPVLRFAPATVDVGRWVSLAAVVIAAFGFWTAARRARVHPAASAVVVALWLVTPRVVITGNIARHEALVLALLAWALVATLSGRRVGALSLAGLAALTHPAGIAFAVVIVLANLRKKHAQPSARWERWLAAGVLAFVAFEVVHFAANFEVAREQLRFQLHRKTGHGDPTAKLITVVLLAAGTAIIVRLRHRIGTPAVTFVGLALAGIAVNRLGLEMWYEVYGNETAALFVALAALAALGVVATADRQQLYTGAIAVALAAVFFLPGGYAKPFYGMRFGQPANEWSAFVVDVRAELNRLSAASTLPKLVAINDLSGLPWPTETDQIGTLRFVKATSITPTVENYDYLLFARTVCCSGKAPLPKGSPIAQVTSPNDLFDATIFAAP